MWQTSWSRGTICYQAFLINSNYGKSSVVKKLNPAVLEKDWVWHRGSQSVNVYQDGLRRHQYAQLKRDQLKFLKRSSHAVTEQIGHCYVIEICSWAVDCVLVGLYSFVLSLSVLVLICCSLRELYLS